MSALVVLLAALLVFPTAAAAASAPGASGSVRLSNEWTHYLTEDGFPEVYPILRSWRDSKWHTWLEARIPMRPNGRTGWVCRSALGPYYRVRTLLVVARGRLRATIYRRGQRIWTAPVGIGKPSTPTPAGHSWTREKFRTPGPGGLPGQPSHDCIRVRNQGVRRLWRLMPIGTRCSFDRRR